MKNTRTEYSLTCAEIIEMIIGRDINCIDEVIQYLYENYTDDNMIKAIKYINKEYARLDLNTDMDYINAYKRLEQILKSIKELKEVYTANDIEIKSNTLLTICNKHHKNNKYYTICGTLDKYYLSMHDTQANYTLINPYTDIWNSVENDILYAKDKNDNMYKFTYKNNKYILTDAYTLNNKQLLRGIKYKSIFGYSINTL